MHLSQFLSQLLSTLSNDIFKFIQYLTNYASFSRLIILETFFQTRLHLLARERCNLKYRLFSQDTTQVAMFGAYCPSSSRLCVPGSRSQSSHRVRQRIATSAAEPVVNYPLSWLFDHFVHASKTTIDRDKATATDIEQFPEKKRREKRPKSPKTNRGNPELAFSVSCEWPSLNFDHGFFASDVNHARNLFADESELWKNFSCFFGVQDLFSRVFDKMSKILILECSIEIHEVVDYFMDEKNMLQSIIVQ